MKLITTAKMMSSLTSLLLLLMLAGCEQRTEAPPEMLISQVPEAMEKVFKKAPPKIKSLSDEVLIALKQKETDKALLILQDLSNEPDLTTKQRVVATSSMLAVNQEVQVAAASGDKNSELVVQYRRMSK